MTPRLLAVLKKYGMTQKGIDWIAAELKKPASTLLAPEYQVKRRR